MPCHQPHKKNFRTRGDKVFAFAARQPELPNKPTRQQRALYKRALVINQCINILQDEFHDWTLALKVRPIMKNRLLRLYEKYAPDIKARTKLQGRILGEYRSKWNSERLNRGNIGTTSGEYRE